MGSKDVTDGRERRQYLNRDHCLERRQVDQVHDFPAKRFDPLPTEKDRVESSGILAIFCVDLCGPGGPCPWVPGFTTSPAPLRSIATCLQTLQGCEVCSGKVYPEIGAMGKF